MSFEPPAGILDIGNATLRVGKLEVTETTGLNQGLQNIVKNDLLITETAEYSSDKHWGLKLPTTWVAEFEVKGETDKYVEFNFYNEGSTSNAYGYTLNFRNTTLTLKFDENELSPGYPGSPATIPTIVGTFRKVNVFLERGVIAVYIDGARVLYYKFGDGYNANLGVPERVISTTGSAFLNLFIEANSSSAAFKNLRIVNGRFISDKTSNVSFIGSLGVGVHSPKESLDIRGNMHFNRVSNVSQVSVDSNVVTEYTGPHDRPLRKYPEVALTADAETASGYKGYKVTTNGNYSGRFGWEAFDSNPLGSAWATEDATYSHSGDGEDANTAGQTAGTFTAGGVDYTGHWIKLELPKAIKLQRAFVNAYNNDTAGNDDRRPKKGVFLGSNDDSIWDLVHAFDGDLGWGDTTSNQDGATINFSNISTKYKYILLLVEEKQLPSSSSATRIEIFNIEYYGYEEGSGSLDTTLKTVYNVPATTGTQLEVYYDAKGESTVQSPIPDLSPNTNTGAVFGHSPTLDSTDGIDSFKFNGSSQYVTGAHGLTTGSGPVHTISLWLNATEMTNFSYAVQLGQGGTSHQQSAIMFYENKISHAHWVSGVLSEVTIANNVWYHVVAVFTGGNGSDISKHKIFINGEDGGVVAFPGSTDGPVVLTGTQLTLGRKEHAGGTPGDYFNGSIANFRLYSKALNADQVKELYDYQKDYFLGSKSQVTLYKGHLGVGVTEPSGQLELAGDERIQEYPPRAMTDFDTHIEGHGVFTAIVSSNWSSTSTYAAYNIFDKTFSTNWVSAGNGSSVDTYNATTGLADTALTPDIFQGVKGSWAKLKLPYAIKPLKVQITPRATTETSPPPRQPKSGIVWGSKDDVYWEQISSFNFSTAADEYFMDVNTNEYYSSLVLQVTATRTDLTGDVDAVVIRELRYFGTPGPTTLDKGSLSLTRSLDVPRVSRYDVDTETPRPEKLVLDFDTTVNSTPTDISGKGNHGTITGATYSPADKAFVFDGTADYINIASLNPAPDGEWIHTISIWIYITPTATGGRIIDISGGNTARTVPHLAWSSGTIRWDMYGSHCAFSETFETDRWYHLVLQYIGGTLGKNTVLLWRDGVFDADRTYSGDTNGPLAVASSDRVRFMENMSGMISNIKFYNVALEPSEVRKLYKLGRTGRSMVISDTAVGIGKAPEAQLDVRGITRMENLICGFIGNRLVDEAEVYYDPTRAECQDGSHVFQSGTTINDINGNHPGTIDNSTKYNYFWSTNGTDGCIRTTNNIDMRRDWTIMVWIGPVGTNTGSYWRVAGHGQTSTHTGLHIQGAGSDQIRFGLQGNDMDGGKITGLTTKREWNCITASYYHNGGVNGIDRKLYQNERLIAHQQGNYGDGYHFGLSSPSGGNGIAQGHPPYQATPTPLRFGTSYGSGNYGVTSLQIGPCLMIPRFLSDSEVRSLYRHFASVFPGQINVG